MMINIIFIGIFAVTNTEASTGVSDLMIMWGNWETSGSAADRGLKEVVNLLIYLSTLTATAVWNMCLEI